MAYAPAIAGPPDDLAAQLERLFENPPPDPDPGHPVTPDAEVGPSAAGGTLDLSDGALADAFEEVANEPRAPSDPPSPPEPLAEEPTVASVLEPALDELRDQLDVAFDEVVGRIQRVEARVAGLRQVADSQTGEMGDLDRRLTELVLGASGRSEAALDQVLLGTSQVEATLADVQARLAQAEGSLRELLGRPVLGDATLVELRSDTAHAAAGIDETLNGTEATHAALDDLGARLGRTDARLHELSAAVAELRLIPVAVDTRALEAATRDSSLHNAADIANLRRAVEMLTEVVRQQDESLTDVRSTLDWIKERLLR